MASRSKQSFAKRQKEMARKEKQERKMQRRQERKQARADGVDWHVPDENAEPVLHPADQEAKVS